MGAEQAADAVEAARRAQPLWAKLETEQRAEYMEVVAAELDALRSLVLRGAGDAGDDVEKVAAVAAAALAAIDSAAGGDANATELAVLRAEVESLRERASGSGGSAATAPRPQSHDEAAGLREANAELTRRCGELSAEAAEAPRAARAGSGERRHAPP